MRWLATARPTQVAPPGDWRTWLVLAGRGFGKTRTAAEDAWWYAACNPGHQVAVVAPTHNDVRGTMFEGVSGLIACTPQEVIADYNRSNQELRLINGALIRGFSAEKPDRLRGPQFHRAYADEQAEAARLAAHEDVPGDRLLHRERAVLEHRFDAGLARLGRGHRGPGHHAGAPSARGSVLRPDERRDGGGDVVDVTAGFRLERVPPVAAAQHLLDAGHVRLGVPPVTALSPAGGGTPVPGLPGAEGRGAHPGAVGQIADRQGLRGSRFRGHAVEHNFNRLSKKVSTADNDS